MYIYTRPSSIRPPPHVSPTLLIAMFSRKTDFQTIILPLSFANRDVRHPPRVIQFKTLTKSFDSPPAIRHA